MTILQSGVIPSTGGYQIERSLRFNSADSAYLNRTPASAGNRKTWTWSGWFKTVAQGGNYTIISTGSSGNYTQVLLTGSQLSATAQTSSSYTLIQNSSALFRDPSAWYHFVWAVDTTQATAANRSKMYINGTQIAIDGSPTYPSQNADLWVNAAAAHFMGQSFASSNYFSGYLTEINFIDGQALTPSDFGETDAQTGVWKPKAYSGTYGTNGFYLKFADNSGTTSTTLGKDSSGNGNNWTPNNFSVTAGSGNDSMVDSPTSYGTDTGVGGEVRGNYCTWNPLRYATSVTYANGNLEATFTNNVPTASTIAIPSTGKWYFEASPSAITFFDDLIQTAIGLIPQSTGTQDANQTGLTYAGNGKKVNAGTASTYGASYAANDIIGVAVDMDAATLTFYKNGSSQGTAFTSISTTTTWFASACQRNSGTWTLNAGQRPFAYTAPSGFKALCTTNLPTPTIGATSTTQANDYFNVVTYTGNGTSLSVTGVGFQPDLIWIKDRSNARAHVLQNAIAGFSQYLQSNATDAETTASSGVTAVGSDGFTVGTQLAWNSNTETYVAWNWNAGGSNATNTSGTITSTVRANTTSGFSIVTYTGTGSNATVGHGLGVAPSMIILKGRTNADQWFIWHNTFTSSQYIYFNTTAIVSGANPWNSTLPTSTLFSLGTDAGVNGNGTTYVAYCFAPVAGYSAFGSYTGNGSSDGPFVYTGFRPRYVLIKRTDTTNNWFVSDSSIAPYNLVENGLYPNLSNAEGAINALDFLSNGFKPRANYAGANASGGTYIYAAFAESPFKYSLAR